MIRSASVDCANMMNLAEGLGIQVAQPIIWVQLQIDCCAANGIFCFGQLVTRIDWSNMGLNGFINETAIPPGLDHLWLHNNQLTGKFPMNLPSGLFHLDLSGNLLTGALPSLLPVGLQTLYIDKNLLSGDLPDFPNTIEFIHLGRHASPENRFTGTLRLNRPKEFWITNNWITDVFIQNTSAIIGCTLDNNPLLGSANIAGLTLCTQSGLYSAGLLPNTVTTKKTIAITSTNSFAMFTSTPVITISTNLLKTTAGLHPSTEIPNDFSTITISMAKSGNNTWTRLETLRIVQFDQQQISGAAFNLKIVLRLLIDAMIFSVVLSKTPLRRQLKKITNKAKKTEV